VAWSDLREGAGVRGGGGGGGGGGSYLGCTFTCTLLLNDLDERAATSHTLYTRHESLYIGDMSHSIKETRVTLYTKRPL
jgi:hypothetical protein